MLGWVGVKLALMGPPKPDREGWPCTRQPPCAVGMNTDSRARCQPRFPVFNVGFAQAARIDCALSGEPDKSRASALCASRSLVKTPTTSRGPEPTVKITTWPEG